MKATLFTAAAALLVASVSAIPVADMAYVTQPNTQDAPKPDCDDTPAKNLPCGATKTEVYVVKKGDILTNIANQFKSGICDIAKYNNITNPDLIQPDQKLTIPAMCTTKPDNDSCIKRVQPANFTDTCVKGVSVNPAVYYVLPKDTLTLIANNFNITLDSLVAANRQIPDINNLAINQTINVPVCQGYSCTNRPYTVQSGNTFSGIAQAAGITIGQIETANPRQIPEQLQVGQVINVPLCSGIA